MTTYRVYLHGQSAITVRASSVTDAGDAGVLRMLQETEAGLRAIEGMPLVTTVFDYSAKKGWCVLTEKILDRLRERYGQTNQTPQSPGGRRRRPHRST